MSAASVTTFLFLLAVFQFSAARGKSVLQLAVWSITAVFNALLSECKCEEGCLDNEECCEYCEAGES